MSCNITKPDITLISSNISMHCLKNETNVCHIYRFIDSNYCFRAYILLAFLRMLTESLRKHTWETGISILAWHCPVCYQVKHSQTTGEHGNSTVVSGHHFPSDLRHICPYAAGDPNTRPICVIDNTTFRGILIN